MSNASFCKACRAGLFSGLALYNLRAVDQDTAQGPLHGLCRALDRSYRPEHLLRPPRSVR